MKNILCLFDYGVNVHTGFATASKNIIQEIKKEFKGELHLDILAINYFGKKNEEDPNAKYPIIDYFEEDGTYVISAKLSEEFAKQNLEGAKKEGDDFGRYFFLKCLKERDYDGVFIIQDLGVIQPIIPIMEDIKLEKQKANKKQFKSIFYFPIDCRIIKPLVKKLEFFDNIITYTDYGKEEVCRFKPELRSRIKVIPHGNNSKDFYYVEDREEVAKFRKAYFEENAEKFIISNINRNQPRKDIPTTIFAFQELKNNWKHEKKPFLYLHMNPKDHLGWDLRALLLQTDLKEYEDYMFPPPHMENHGASVDFLRMIYNCTDLYITTNLGEGWGLSITEAMGSKVPVIAPLHTSITEISANGKRIYPITEFIPFCGWNDNLHRDMCFIDNVVEVMEDAVENIINDTEKNKEKINLAYEYVKSLDWKGIAKRFVEQFKKTY
jgi:glycosyltransferase involved in cell wall biosynthesis